jgi:hypothetical protein
VKLRYLRRQGWFRSLNKQKLQLGILDFCISSRRHDLLHDLPAAFYAFIDQVNVSELIPIDLLEMSRNKVVEPTSPEGDIRTALMRLIPSVESYSMASVKGPATIQHRGHASLEHQILNILERKLRPDSLSSCNHNDLRALFLMIFASIFNVALAEPAVDLPPFPGVSQDIHCPLRHRTNKNFLQENQNLSGIPRSLYDVLREHLCHMLVHYMIFIGSKLGFLEFVDMNKTLISKNLTVSMILRRTLEIFWTRHWLKYNFERKMGRGQSEMAPQRMRRRVSYLSVTD